MTQPTDPNQPPQSAVPPPPPAGAPAPAAHPSSGYPAAPAANPYGGGPAYPGSKAYVEHNFGPVADFGTRAGALIIDGLLGMIGIVPVLIGAGLLVAAAPSIDDYGYTIEGTGNGGLAVTGGVLIFLGLVLTLAIALWNRVFKMGRTGQSVGKKVMGLKLIGVQTGQPIGAMQSFLRELLGGLINQIFYLSYLWMLWDDNKQTLADKVVNSTVIKVPKS